MPHSVARPLAGLLTIAVIVGIVAFAANMFRGGFAETTVPVTVLSTRAGLVMNPDARVQMRGVQVGKVDSIEELPDGQAALHLATAPELAEVTGRYFIRDRETRSPEMSYDPQLQQRIWDLSTTYATAPTTNHNA